MSRFFVSPSDIEAGCVTIKGQDASHISLSLRMREGEEISVCDGSGEVLYCELSGIGKELVTARIVRREMAISELPCRVHLYQCLPKGDKLELIIQKATELGVSDITPVLSSRCISRPDERSQAKKLVRYNAIAREASMQSKRCAPSVVNPTVDISKALSLCKESDVRLFCYEGGGERLGSLLLPDARDISVFIGPEGGFSEKEAELAAEHGFTAVTLGPRILRCETAPIALMAMLGYRYELC